MSNSHITSPTISEYPTALSDAISAAAQLMAGVAKEPLSDCLDIYGLRQITHELHALLDHAAAVTQALAVGFAGAIDEPLEQFDRAQMAEVNQVPSLILDSAALLIKSRNQVENTLPALWGMA
jgi:hypothetical protein